MSTKKLTTSSAKSIGLPSSGRSNGFLFEHRRLEPRARSSGRSSTGRRRFVADSAAPCEYRRESVTAPNLSLHCYVFPCEIGTVGRKSDANQLEQASRPPTCFVSGAIPEMNLRDLSRRTFVKSCLAASPVIHAVHHWPAQAQEKPRSPNDRIQIGCIGLRYQGSVIAHEARKFGDIVALCDVDRHVLEQGRAAFGSRPAIFEDYRDMLAREDLDVVTIGTPDHWHAKILVDACRAQKDVYCEKPLTLTIDEGKAIRNAVDSTNRIVQVGSWQRSDHRFRLAAEMVRQGRVGQLQQVDVVLGKNKQGGPFAIDDPPPELNWNLWQGQTPEVPFLHERCHYTFRWWYAYSGGQMTDWGAHHLDIAQWGIGERPIAIETTARFPNTDRGYDVATDFGAKYTYPSGVTMTVSDSGRNGIMFVGTEGRIFVNRGTIAGRPVEMLERSPLPRSNYVLYKSDNLERPPRMGKLDAIYNHMGNFFDCVDSRQQPLSDVESQHHSATTCHLGNISMWEGRSLVWDPGTESFPGDEAANKHLRREQRTGFELS